MAVLSFGCAATALKAEDAAPSAEIVPGSYRVLRRHVVHDGQGPVVITTITPPEFRVVPPEPPPAPTPEELAKAQAQAGKRHGMLSVGATVFDHEVSELHWAGADGRRHVVYSNIDFSVIAGMGQFETAEAVYSLTLAWGNASRDSAEGAAVPPLSVFPQASVYLVAPSDSFGPADEAMLQALDDLHAYYDAHREEVRAAHDERVARMAAAVEAARLKALEPAPAVVERSILVWSKQEPLPVKAPASTEGGQP